MEANSEQVEEKLIDVERVIQSKNPRLLQLMPNFIINYLKRIIHQEEVNAFLTENKSKFGLKFVAAAIAEFQPIIAIHGSEYLSENKRIVIASNHPLGGLDGIVLMHSIGKVRKEIQFPVNDILLNLENLKPLFVPINKHGSNLDNVRILNETFEGEAVVCYFPFGLVSRKKNGVIQDLDWKKTFLTKAKKYKRDIVPTYIEGRNSNFFYNLSNLRKKLGVKVNIEMLFLVDEFFKQKNKEITITFGKPIPWQMFDNRYSDAIWAEKIRRFVYKLANNPEVLFDPED